MGFILLGVAIDIQFVLPQNFEIVKYIYYTISVATSSCYMCDHIIVSSSCEKQVVFGGWDVVFLLALTLSV